LTGIELFNMHAPGIQEALDRCGDPRTIEDVAQEILQHSAQVWGDERALIITQLAFPYLHYWIATGEIKAVVELSHTIRAWAKALGYSKATLTGRRGWVRALAGDGWTERAVLMGREI
jgi:hypothetical protein